MAEIKLTDTKNLYLRDVTLIIIPISGDSKQIKDLKISFECEKTNTSDPNPARIQVYNLNENSRSILEKKGTRVILDAGYIHNAATIFKGNITRVYHASEPPDIITTIECADGDNRYRNTYLEKGYPPGVKLEQLINELSDSLGLPVGSIVDLPATQYANGLTLSGSVKDHLNYLCEKNNLEWSIQDETLQIIAKKGTTTDEIIVLTPKTGLIGSPAKIKATEDNGEGVQFKSLLQPKLRPGRRVKIESKFMNGTFKIRKVTHSGDSLSGEFYSDCECK